MNVTRILFVCLGNICRSPTAEAVFRERARQAGLLPTVSIDSCGTGGWHVGKPPDRRAAEAAAARGYDLSMLRARQLCDEDFHRFDLMLAMDESNLAEIHTRHVPGAAAQTKLFLDFHPKAGRADVPDPYYGGVAGFDQVLDLVEAASAGLIAHLQARLG